MNKRMVSLMHGNRLVNKIALPILVAAFLAPMASAKPKHKQKPALPDVVWQARSVAVVILPNSPDPAGDPSANEKAKQDVEDAILKWKRFRLEMEPSVADIVVGVRKGSGKLANPTVSHGPMDSPSGTIEATDDTVRIGVSQHQAANTPPTPGVAVGGGDDVLEIFLQGGSAPVWKYVAKDGLKAPGMLAVGKFREAVEEAEDAAKQKQQAKTPAQKKTP